MPFSYIKREDGLLQCPFCDYAKERMSTVHMHIKAKHTNEPKPVMKELDLGCPCCAFTCKQVPQLRSHYVTQHLTSALNTLMGNTLPKGANLVCTECKVQFKSRAAFMYHCVKCLPESVKECAADRIGLCLD